ncbi:MAG: hypothetical protein IKY48_06740 [Bacteroidales bacterium]|nr:hypothetical protein [Bacteroidales bacterium]
MSRKVSIERTCKDCAFNDCGVCRKINLAVSPLQYACSRFMTKAEWDAFVEQRKQERYRREEHRLNMLLTGLIISSTSTQMLMEYFDKEFTDASVERQWRQERKKAAREIMRLCQRIRDIYQYSFFKDQMQVMTASGTQAFDYVAYDSHEDDARRWTRRLLYDLDRSWGNDDTEDKIDEFYQSLPDNNTFDERDYRHFTTKR